MDHLNRRDLLRQVTTLSAGSVVAGMRSSSSVSAFAGGAAAQEHTDAPKFFPGFKSFSVKTSGATINGVIGGQGPPLLLLHGAPQSHISWRIVAPKLAADHTVVVADLRGYG